MENLTVEGLQKVLAEMPPKADVIISMLCVGRITTAQIEYDAELNQVWFKQKSKSKEFDFENSIK